MSVSKVSICNLALLQLGADTITALTEDSKEARQCNIVYDMERKKLLRAHPWNFAIKRQVLSQLTATPSFEFAYQYQLPNDCLRVLSMYGYTGKFVIEGRKLLTDASSASIIYIKDDEDPANFDSVFIQCLALSLAHRLAYSITGSASLSQSILQEFERVRREAKQWDGQEGIALTWDNGEWIDEFIGD